MPRFSSKNIKLYSLSNFIVKSLALSSIVLGRTIADVKIRLEDAFVCFKIITKEKFFGSTLPSTAEFDFYRVKRPETKGCAKKMKQIDFLHLVWALKSLGNCRLVNKVNLKAELKKYSKVAFEQVLVQP